MELTLYTCNELIGLSCRNLKTMIQIIVLYCTIYTISTPISTKATFMRADVYRRTPLHTIYTFSK